MARAGNSLALAEETPDAQTSIRLLTGTSLGKRPQWWMACPPAGIAATGKHGRALQPSSASRSSTSPRRPATKTIIPNSTSLRRVASAVVVQTARRSSSWTDTSVAGVEHDDAHAVAKVHRPRVTGGDQTVANDAQQPVAAIRHERRRGVDHSSIHQPPLPALYPRAERELVLQKGGHRRKADAAVSTAVTPICSRSRLHHGWIGSIRTGGLVERRGRRTTRFLHVETAAAPSGSNSLDGTQLAERTIINITPSRCRSGSASSAACRGVAGSKDCLHCAEQTTLIDPQTLVPAGTQTGGIVDVLGRRPTRLYAIVSLPNELRAIKRHRPAASLGHRRAACSMPRRI